MRSSRATGLWIDGGGAALRPTMTPKEDKEQTTWRSALGELLDDEDPEKSRRVMEAMLQMSKIEIEGLQRAYEAG
jgi:hypothetical protein